jgi:GDP-4-dehydro-6-deoxy-D-mannose reductase
MDARRGTMKKILVTGASGYTGFHACKHFSLSGYKVFGLVNSNKEKIQNISMYECDLMKTKQLDSIMEKVQPDFILHLAGENNVGKSWENPLHSFQVNVTGTLNLLEAVRKFVPKSKVLIIGSVIDFNPCDGMQANHPYGVTKYFQTLLAQCWAGLFNIHVLLARPSNLVGPGQSSGVSSIFAKKIVITENQHKMTDLTIKNIHVQRDFLDVRDAVRAYEILLNKGEAQQTYDVGTGVSRSLEELVATLSLFSKAKVNCQTDLQAEPENNFIVNIDEISKLGWTPSISFEQSMEDTLNYYRGMCE